MKDRLLLLGRKIGMTRLFDASACLLPVTVIEVDPCFVTQIKTIASDGYSAVQIGSEPKKRASRPLTGHLKKCGVAGLSRLKEFRGHEEGQFSLGDRLDVTSFKMGDKVDVIAQTKGKGFQGVMKRHGFSGGPGGHGSMTHRRGGSFGMRAHPGHILKNQKMPGHDGCARRTAQNLVVVKIDPERNILVIKGSVPGFNGAPVVVRRAKKS